VSKKGTKAPLTQAPETEIEETQSKSPIEGTLASEETLETVVPPAETETVPKDTESPPLEPVKQKTKSKRRKPTPETATPAEPEPGETETAPLVAVETKTEPLKPEEQRTKSKEKKSSPKKSFETDSDSEERQTDEIVVESKAQIFKKILPPIQEFLDPNTISGLAMTLTFLCIVVSLLLAVANSLTADIIAKRQEETTSKAMLAVITADEFVESEDSTLYLAYSNSELVGYTVQVFPSGYGGEIAMVVGIDTNLKITAVSLVRHSETPQIGSKIASEDWFFPQFQNKGGVLAYDNQELSAITGATVSSKAVLKGINAALTQVTLYVAGGGSQ
jgi:electron transport complex protein RnfG